MGVPAPADRRVFGWKRRCACARRAVFPVLATSCPCSISPGAVQLAGHEVRVATNEEFHAVIAGAGLRPVSAGMSNVEMREQRSRRWPETGAQPVSVSATRMWAQVMAPSTLGGPSGVHGGVATGRGATPKKASTPRRSRPRKRGSHGSRRFGEARCGQRASSQRLRIWPRRFGSGACGGVTCPRQRASTPTRW